MHLLSSDVAVNGAGKPNGRDRGGESCGEYNFEQIPVVRDGN